MYVEQYYVKQDEIIAINQDHWRRFRIQWANTLNINRRKGAPAVFPHQLYRLPEDDRKPEYHEIDIEAMKRRFGSKLKKKDGK